MHTETAGRIIGAAVLWEFTVLPESENDDEDVVADETQDPAQPEIENDPLRTPDPASLVEQLQGELRDLWNRRDAQDHCRQIEKLAAELKRDPAEREAVEQQSKLRKTEERASRGIPHGTKSTMRSIGRLLARCENAFEDLIETSDKADLEMRLKIALAAARLASAASSLGAAMSSNARARATLARTNRKPRPPRADSRSQEPEALS